LLEELGDDISGKELNRKLYMEKRSTDYSSLLHHEND
jgi:hypothetical protein